MVMHSALQDYVNCCCRESDELRDTFELSSLPTYSMVYSLHCSKSGRGKGAAAGGRRHIASNMGFTREKMYEMSRTLLGSSDPAAARNLSLVPDCDGVQGRRCAAPQAAGAAAEVPARNW